MKQTLFIILFLLSLNSFSQEKPFSEIIETDSSTIEIIRNSLYKCWEETYKFKDSSRFISWFIDDTTQVHYENWGRKNSNSYIGISREYKKDGTLMYEWDHDKDIYKVNRTFYPFYELLEKMKAIADSLIISAYSKEFFEKHVRFDYDCYTYDKEGYVGSWTEPIERKPSEFLFRYSVRLSGSEWINEMIGMKIDSNGLYMPDEGFFGDPRGFEKVKSDYSTFNIGKNKAIVIAKEHGLIQTDSSEISEFLTWKSFEKLEFYNGQFLYYITEYTGKTEYKEGNDRKGIIFRFNVYSFNPWTGEFIEKKKMKSIKEWGKNSGHSTGLMNDNE